MNATNQIEELELVYGPIVKKFVPDFKDRASDIGYEIDLFFADNAEKYANVRNIRIKQDGDILSETIYDAMRFESQAKFQEEDLYIPVNLEGNATLFFGFDYDKP